MGMENTYTDRGTLTVSVTVANRAIPIPEAKVTISRDTDSGEEVMRVMQTDASGNTERISLPAPPAQNSLSPGNSNVYSSYNVRVEKDGYYITENRDVPVFAGRTSIQPVALQALPFGMKNDEVLTDVETEPRDLLPGKEDER